MRRFRIRRRRALALALVPAAALTIGSQSSNAAPTERQAAIDPAKAAVPFGERVTLRGHFPSAPRKPVAIQYRAANAEGFRQVATTRTNASSRWTARVKPKGTGMWRARLSSVPRAPSGEEELIETAQPIDSETGAKRVRVRAVVNVHAKNHTIVGRGVKIKGKVRPGGSRKVVVDVGDKRMKTRADAKGRFDTRWRAGSTGTYKVSADARGNARATGASARGGRVTAYRTASASWYGPGFYGNRTACGQTLGAGTLGVAHKTMPCGTKLKLRHGSRTVKVEVIDRGPYAAGREFDLTAATRNRLGFGSTGTILTSR
jgi:rare lipoprotein A